MVSIPNVYCWRERLSLRHRHSMCQNSTTFEDKDAQILKNELDYYEDAVNKTYDQRCCGMELEIARATSYFQVTSILLLYLQKAAVEIARATRYFQGTSILLLYLQTAAVEIARATKASSRLPVYYCCTINTVAANVQVYVAARYPVDS